MEAPRKCAGDGEDPGVGGGDEGVTRLPTHLGHLARRQAGLGEGLNDLVVGQWLELAVCREEVVQLLLRQLGDLWVQVDGSLVADHREVLAAELPFHEGQAIEADGEVAHHRGVPDRVLEEVGGLEDA